MSALFTQCPGDSVQTGTGKVDPARKFKSTTAARGLSLLKKDKFCKVTSLHQMHQSVSHIHRETTNFSVKKYDIFIIYVQKIGVKCTIVNQATS